MKIFLIAAVLSAQLCTTDTYIDARGKVSFCTRCCDKAGNCTVYCY